jgi:2-amino-4-hydroxy-6-hydroxymethyldihydropteridine diphosphokinase
MPTCLIGLGSNLGDRAARLEFALSRLRTTPGIELVAHSSWLETKAIGGPAGQSPFLNGAAIIETTLEPEALLKAFQRIEDDAGRRREELWGPRTLDLDLLLFGQEIIDTPSLTAPHPRMAFRRFVLEPAVQIAGEMKHPGIGWTVEQLWRHLSEAPQYVALAGPFCEAKTKLMEQVAYWGDFKKTTGLGGPGGVAWLPKRLAATSPSSIWQTAIEFLDAWENMLSTATWNDPQASWKPRDFTSWLITDFWFHVLPIFLARVLDEAQRRQFQARFAAALPKIVSPKLTVIVEPADVGPAEKRHLLEAAGAIVGPSLTVSAAQEDAAVKEVIAAIEAMSP